MVEAMGKFVSGSWEGISRGGLNFLDLVLLEYRKISPLINCPGPGRFIISGQSSEIDDRPNILSLPKFSKAWLSYYWRFRKVLVQASSLKVKSYGIRYKYRYSLSMIPVMRNLPRVFLLGACSHH